MAVDIKASKSKDFLITLRFISEILCSITYKYRNVVAEWDKPVQLPSYRVQL